MSLLYMHMSGVQRPIAVIFGDYKCKCLHFSRDLLHTPDGFEHS